MADSLSRLPSNDDQVEQILREPWDLLDEARGYSDRLRSRRIKELEQLGAAEARVRQDYFGRYPIELLQNAHDACADGHIVGQAWFRVTDSALLVGNEGQAFD